MPDGSDNTTATETDAATTSANTGDLVVTTTGSNTTTNTPAAAQSDATGPDGEPFDPERAQATIQKLREKEKEGKKAAKERDDLAARLAALEDAQKSDQEKQTERLATLEAEQERWQVERRELRLAQAVLSQAGHLGVVDADLALAAIDRASIEYDDDGNPSNVNDVLGDLLERKPILKGKAAPSSAGSIDAGAGRQDAPAPKLTPEEAEAAAAVGMDPARYEQMKGVRSLNDYLAVSTGGGEQEG